MMSARTEGKPAQGGKGGRGPATAAWRRNGWEGPSSESLTRFLRRVYPFAYASIFAWVLVSLPLDGFKDRDNYLVYAAASDTILAGNVARGLLKAMFNEPLWLGMNIWLSDYLDAETTLRAIIFIPAFVVAFVVLRHNPRAALWLSIFLLTPAVVKNHIIHLRQGAGIAVFLLGYFAGPRWLRLALMTAAGFIHSSLLCIVLIHAAVRATGKLRLSPALRLVLIFVFSIALGVMFESIAGGLGARQGEQYAAATLEISGLGMAFWFCVLVLFLSAGSHFIRRNLFPISILAFYISVYFLTPLSGRIFESGVLLVLLAGLALRGWRRQAFIAAYLLFSGLLYMSRLDQPWLGWGV